MDWDDYTLDDSGVRGPWDEPAPRAEARSAYNRLLANKDERVAFLGALVQANGFSLGDSDGDIQRLNDWFRANVEAGEHRQVNAAWASVSRDVALFLGDVIVARRNDGVDWRFFDKPPSITFGYHRPVLMGYPNQPDPAFSVYLEGIVWSHGNGMLGTLRVREADFFVRTVERNVTDY